MYTHRSIIKLTNPYYGNKLDALNKMAVVVLLIDNKKLDEEYEKHFDKILNYNLYKWRNAIITD